MYNLIDSTEDFYENYWKRNSKIDGSASLSPEEQRKQEDNLRNRFLEKVRMEETKFREREAKVSTINIVDNVARSVQYRSRANPFPNQESREGTFGILII